MLLCFELTIPHVNSWNGKWSGEKNYYAEVRDFGRSRRANEKAQAILDKWYFRYNFDDGWSAGIHVKQVTGREAARIKSKSDGFLGYSWMIDSIRDKMKITAPET